MSIRFALFHSVLVKLLCFGEAAKAFFEESGSSYQRGRRRGKLPVLEFYGSIGRLLGRKVWLEMQQFPDTHKLASVGGFHTRL